MMNGMNFKSSLMCLQCLAARKDLVLNKLREVSVIYIRQLSSTTETKKKVRPRMKAWYIYQYGGKSCWAFVEEQKVAHTECVKKCVKLGPVLSGQIC